ncbi:hypothetical protein LTS08_003597 [Lithohypha guttulata]|nr:hypothetical protein LTS08_003597 [Lithohypha guttulata]
MRRFHHQPQSQVPDREPSVSPAPFSPLPCRTASPQLSLTTSNDRRESASGSGRAEIWPSNTVRVKRLDKRRSPERVGAWDLAADFNLAEFALLGKRQRAPQVIEDYLKKATQQYQNDVPEASKQVPDQEEPVDVEQPAASKLQRSYSFDHSGSTHDSTYDSKQPNDEPSEEAEYCCDDTKRRAAQGVGGVYFCYACKITYCDDCWAAQIPHKRQVPGHRMVDVTIARIIQNTLDVELTEQEQARLHLLDECTSWFGAAKDKEGAVFRDFGRYATLVAERNSDERKRCYPALVSFVGETGAGKSSLIKLLVSTTKPGASAPTPVVGSTTNSETPTSGDVHLYADPHTFDQDRPVLYADCEGLHGGTLEPMGVKLRARRAAAPAVSRPRTASFEKHLRRRHETAEREIAWAKTPERTTRKYFVENLYPRLLYTFSDVIVFVVKNARTIEDVVEQLISWADAVIQSSSNQPVLPHAIIVLNASDNKDERLWDVDVSTTALLNNVRVAVNQNPILKKYAAKWGYRIDSAQSLLLSYYSSIRVVRIPEKSQPTLIHRQIQRLYSEINVASSSSHSAKHRVRMKLNCEELQPYLQRAFDHFCSDLDDAFDFVKASYANSSIPSDFSGNILKIAVSIMQKWQNKLTGPLLFKELSFLVAGCVMLDAIRQGKLGTAAQVLPEYLDHFDEAIEEFCDKFWPCEFVTLKGRCVNVKAGHKKGHQSRKGEVLGTTAYQSSFTASAYRHEFLDDIYAHLNELLEDLAAESKSMASIEQEVAARLHRTKILGPFFRHLGGAQKFISHSACLACLVGPAEYSLPCGHVLCKPCLTDFGNVKGPTLVEMRFCPLHDNETSHFRWPVTIVPPNAGIRILTIDGGGARGIVPLLMLRRLEHEFGLPIQNFFDLIIGTSTGGIIGLGLGEKGWSVDECITKFERLVKTAFTKHKFLGWDYIDYLIAAYNNGKYKIEPLEALLRSEYGEESLFGGSSRDLKSTGGIAPSKCKVGVTTTTTAGRPCLLANYNRPDVDIRSTPSTPHIGQEDEAVAPLEERGKPYDFIRAEQPADEISTWEAARATSAAPRIFRPYTHGPTGQTFMDGGIYYNNPIEVALREHRLVWPNNRPEGPDVLLSLGTGYTGARKARLADPPSLGIVSHFKQMLKIAVDHVKSSQNSEEQYRSTYDRVPNNLKARFPRLTILVPEGLPKLDDVSAISDLKTVTRENLNSRWSEIRGIANRLLASSFYFEPMSGTTRKNDDHSISMTGSIKCRIAAGTPEISKLGELLRRRCQEAYNNHAVHSPCFVIEEKAKGRDAQQVLLADHVIQGMIEHCQFNLGHIKVTISSPNAMSDIHLRFGNEATRAQNNSISGFPRFWDEEVIKHSRRSLTLSLSRQRQVSRRHRPTWSVPDVKVARVLGRYAEQKNPGLATDEDLQAVEARLSEPTAAYLTTPTARSPASSSNESLIVHGGESPFGRPQGDWARGIKVDPDAPPGYSDPNYVYSGGDSSAGPAELPGHSTADWRLTPAELEEDPFPHIRPDNDPFGPSLDPCVTITMVLVSWVIADEVLQCFWQVYTVSSDV